jgi:hypothetical protein
MNHEASVDEEWGLAESNHLFCGLCCFIQGLPSFAVDPERCMDATSVGYDGWAPQLALAEGLGGAWLEFDPIEFLQCYLQRLWILVVNI